MTGLSRATRVHIRWMIQRDLPEVLEIENDSFSWPWGEDDFMRALRELNVFGMVAERENTVAGFMVYRLNKTRIHLLDLAVAARFRRRWVGSQMIDKLADRLSLQRRARIVVEVRERNVAGQLFFKSNLFRAVAVVHDFYDDTDEDAYRMVRRFDSQPEDPVRNRIAGVAGWS